jgi:hypothetical protein
MYCFYYNQQMHNQYHNSVYHISISLYSVYSYVSQHVYVIIREFYICALPGYLSYEN